MDGLANNGTTIIPVCSSMIWTSLMWMLGILFLKNFNIFRRFYQLFFSKNHMSEAEKKAVESFKNVEIQKKYT